MHKFFACYEMTLSSPGDDILAMFSQNVITSDYIQYLQIGSLMAFELFLLIIEYFFFLLIMWVADALI